MARVEVECTPVPTGAIVLSLHDRLVAHLPDYAPDAAAIAPLISLRDIVPGLAWLSEKITGFSARRPLPRWQRRWFRNHELPNSPADKSSSATVKPPVLRALQFQETLPQLPK